MVFIADAYADTAFTTVKIEAHTDGTYLRDPPGLQARHTI
jgi:hypothetical protein